MFAVLAMIIFFVVIMEKESQEKEAANATIDRTSELALDSEKTGEK